MNELPEWTLPFFDSYTGPNWSDGKWQGSTSRGRSLPKSRLDEQSLIHDAYYATAADLDMLDYADELYYKQTRDMSFVPYVIGAMPKFGNALGRKVARLMGKGYTGSEVVRGENMSNEMPADPGPGKARVQDENGNYSIVDHVAPRKPFQPFKLPTPKPSQSTAEDGGTTAVLTKEPVPQLKFENAGEYTSDGRFVGVTGQQIYGKNGFMHWEPFAGSFVQQLSRYRNRRRVYVS